MSALRDSFCFNIPILIRISYGFDCMLGALTVLQVYSTSDNISMTSQHVRSRNAAEECLSTRQCNHELRRGSRHAFQFERSFPFMLRSNSASTRETCKCMSVMYWSRQDRNTRTRVNSWGNFYVQRLIVTRNRLSNGTSVCFRTFPR